jgi:hypothetical protein
VKWTVQFTPLDALRIDNQWVYGIAQANVNTVAYADGATNSFQAKKDLALPQRGIRGMVDQKVYVEPQVMIVEVGFLLPKEMESAA